MIGKLLRSIPMNYAGAEAFIVVQYEMSENKSEVIYSMLGSALNAVQSASCCTPKAGEMVLS